MRRGHVADKRAGTTNVNKDWGDWALLDFALTVARRWASSRIGLS